MSQKTTPIFTKSLLKDPELWLIVLFNGYLYYEYMQDEALEGTIILIFYSQSVVIGMFHFFKLLYFGASNHTKDPETGVIKSEMGERLGSAAFFALHYGLFHFVYLIFLLVLTVSSKKLPDLNMIGMSILLFTVSSTISVFGDVRRHREGTPVLVHFFTPYARIVPIHLTIMLGFFLEFGDKTDTIPWWTFGMGVFEIFLILKLVVEVAMQLVLREKETVASSE